MNKMKKEYPPLTSMPTFAKGDSPSRGSNLQVDKPHAPLDELAPNIFNPSPDAPSENSQKPSHIVTKEPVGWGLYFPSIDWTPEDFRARLSWAFFEYVFKPLWTADRIPFLIDLEQSGVYRLDYQEIVKLTENQLPDFPALLRNRPEATLGALGSGLCEVRFKIHRLFYVRFSMVLMELPNLYLSIPRIIPQLRKKF